MFQVRIHGRGGQGVVTAAELLSTAAFLEGRQAQAFPSFGSERTGAPVAAYCRIDDRGIRVREPVVAPDGLIVGDPTLLHVVDVLAGFSSQGFLLVNSAQSVRELGLSELTNRLPAHRVLTVPATEIAQRLLGRPLPHAALLGAFAALTHLVALASLEAAIEGRFARELAQANVACVREAHLLAREILEGESRAAVS
jgi:pyruvate ferredoxin oxidoreductase gamma subunit